MLITQDNLNYKLGFSCKFLKYSEQLEISQYKLQIYLYIYGMSVD